MFSCPKVVYNRENVSTLFATQLILAITITGNALLILFLWIQKGRLLLHNILITELIGTLIWTCGIFANLWLKSDVVEYIIFSSAAMALVAQLYFVFLFARGHRRGGYSEYFMSFAFGLGLVFTLISFVPGAVFSKIEVTSAGYTIVYPGWFSIPYAAFVFLFIVSAIALLGYRQRTVMGTTEKSQNKSLLIGFIIFFLTNLFTNSILPVAFGIYFFNGIGPSFSLILTAFIVYIISRHQFLGIRKALQRSFIFSILLSLVLGLYLSILSVLSIFLNSLAQFTIVLSAGATTIIGIFSVPPIERYLKKKTDGFFFKDRYNYAEALYELSEQVNKTISVEEIRLSIVATLRDIFKTKTVTIQTVSEVERAKSLPQPAQDSTSVTLTVPIALDDTTIGTLFLGEKESGDPYTSEDRVLVRTFSHQIAVAFEKARLYSEVESYSRELEKKVEERTTQIRTLQAAQTQMMIDISHKLQNPLTILKNEITNLRRELPDARELLFVERTIDDVSAFMYDLLQLARLDMTLDSLHKERFDMSTLVLELIEYFQVIAHHEGIKLRHEVLPHITLYGDKKRIIEIITNLVSNAVKYMGADDPDNAQITITLTQAHDAFVLTVADTGIGISAHDLPHIFERFYRAHDGARAGIQGTGLGLAICKKIVEMHDGDMSVTSEPGVGTVFTVCLPRNSSSLPAEVSELSPT